MATEIYTFKTADGRIFKGEDREATKKQADDHEFAVSQRAHLDKFTASLAFPQAVTPKGRKLAEGRVRRIVSQYLAWEKAGQPASAGVADVGADGEGSEA